MAEKKTKKYVSADSGTQTDAPVKSGKKMKEAAPVGNAKGLRVGADVLWVLALVMEVLALLVVLCLTLLHCSSALAATKEEISVQARYGSDRCTPERDR